MSDPYAAYRAGSTEPWTVDLLCALVRAMQPHILIETGTFEARTTVKLVEAMDSYGPAHGAALFTIEADSQRAAGARAVLNEIRVRTPNLGVQLVEGDALAFLRAQPEASVEFVFLDDDHTAQHVADEVEAALRILRPGGLVCLHDVVGLFGLDAIVRHYGGLVFDLPRLHASGGLGVIAK